MQGETLEIGVADTEVNQLDNSGAGGAYTGQFDTSQVSTAHMSTLGLEEEEQLDYLDDLPQQDEHAQEHFEPGK